MQNILKILLRKIFETSLFKTWANFFKWFIINLAYDMHIKQSFLHSEYKNNRNVFNLFWP